MLTGVFVENGVDSAVIDNTGVLGSVWVQDNKLVNIIIASEPSATFFL